MERGINGMALLPCDMLTAIEVTKAAGYDVMEVWAPTALAFLAEGNTLADLAAAFKAANLRSYSVVSVENTDTPDGPARRDLEAYCHQLCEIAQAIDCRNIQMESGGYWQRESWPVIREEAGRGLRDLAEIASRYNLIVAYEPLAWLPVHSLEQALEVISEAARPNVKILLDTFQIYAGGGSLATISRRPADQIAGVHLADTAPRHTDVWSDDDRYPMPGDGIVPLHKLMHAVLSTGYDGVITDEINFARYTYWSRQRLARTLKEKGDAILASLEKE